ncbi:hydrolase [Actinocatenispora thailandica]|uniref:Hydrolase n=1 Tax=Actinocatenispora thailandica TaxID=227318 RepID=A0A7R7DX13_9ACTN|nr:alpha/beta hydrolase [Actinocatenispora thailandica]BCJ39324.1 hydrolase [Actinocatenispora thailandica]
MTLVYDEAGTGAPVLLLHSSVCDRRMWDDQVPALAAAGFRTVRCDLRAFGDTPVSREPYRNIDDVQDLLDTLGIDRVSLVGSSYGGGVALEFAATWPARVDALLLLCAAVPGIEPGPAQREFGAKEDALFEADDVAGAVALNVDTWLGPDADETARQRVATMQRRAFDVQLAAGDEMVNPTGPTVDLTRVTARTLAVSGGHDMVDFQAAAAEAARLVPDGQLRELGWAGHFPNLERPAETTELILDFLSASGS